MHSPCLAVCGEFLRFKVIDVQNVTVSYCLPASLLSSLCLLWLCSALEWNNIWCIYIIIICVSMEIIWHHWSLVVFPAQQDVVASLLLSPQLAVDILFLCDLFSLTPSLPPSLSLSSSLLSLLPSSLPSPSPSPIDYLPQEDPWGGDADRGRAR